MLKASEYYLERKTAADTELISLKKRMNWVSVFRLLTMIIFVFMLVRGIKTGHPIWYSVSGVSLVSFFLLVSFHRNLTVKADTARALSAINSNELEGLSGNFSVFDPGTEFLDIQHEFTYDLDIFGPGSLFQFLNRTSTCEGKTLLARDLLNSPCQKDQIRIRQDIHRELAGNPDFMQEFRASGSLAGDRSEDKQEIMEWANQVSFAFTLPRIIKMYGIPAVFVLLLLMGFINPAFYKYTIPMIIVSFLANSFGFVQVNRYHEKISKKHEILTKYLGLTRIISECDFTHPLLREYAGRSRSSLSTFRRLDTLMNFLDARLNIIISSPLNLFFMFDLHIIRALENWKKTNREMLDSFFMTPAHMDAAISFSTFHFNNPGFCWPVIQEDGLEARDLGHPLIPEDKRIVNDFLSTNEKKIFIITGANMAGKSTFLRTLGINMILAGAGAPVCSSVFRYEPLEVITGMRTTDSLADSESYFFAELKRLKRIVEMLGKGVKILVLLDEILKGTNSTDKHNGSIALVKRFTRERCMALIATHDLALGKIATSFPSVIVNLHFESYIHGNELRFDYKLKEGIARNMNASFLMKQMGIIGE